MKDLLVIYAEAGCSEMTYLEWIKTDVVAKFTEFPVAGRSAEDAEEGRAKCSEYVMEV